MQPKTSAGLMVHVAQFLDFGCVVQSSPLPDISWTSRRLRWHKNSVSECGTSGKRWWAV